MPSVSLVSLDESLTLVRSLKVMWELASLLDHDKCAIDVV